MVAPHKTELACACKVQFAETFSRQKKLSKYETEALTAVYCLSKEQEILSFGNIILSTDCRSLTFINRYANNSLAIIYGIDIFLSYW